mmetsp:Transcript_77496/g.230864  ORF Transcript_77496/g.230864 Transcript_77496/m.230864 type:complete len:359 (-) Transcript_77496:116-1192(-)
MGDTADTSAEDTSAQDTSAQNLLGIRTGPATEDEKKMLRTAQLVRQATPEEVEAWLTASSTHMSEKAKTAFLAMTPENQYRVMYEGVLTESKDSTEILYARVQRFMDMESQLKKLANATEARAAEAANRKPKEKKISDLAVAIGKALVSTDLPEEVPESERRCTPVATQPAAEPKKAAPLVGGRKGVGGIIEALQKKYGMQRGERARVVAETKELWKLQGEKTVPKTHCSQGWKWVLQGGDEAAKKKAEAKAKAADTQDAAAKPQEARQEAPAAKEAAADAKERSRSRSKRRRQSRATSEDRQSRARSGERKRGRKDARRRSEDRAGRRDGREGRRRRRSSGSESSRRSGRSPPRRRR